MKIRDAGAGVLIVIVIIGSLFSLFGDGEMKPGEVVVKPFPTPEQTK